MLGLLLATELTARVCHVILVWFVSPLATSLGSVC
jgi:hypothetical protein